MHAVDISLRAGYWRLNVYRDGKRIYSFDDRAGDIISALQCACADTDSSEGVINDLIDTMQQNLSSVSMGFDKRPQSEEEIKKQYRIMAKATHPDSGGSHEAFTAMQKNYQQCLDIFNRERIAE